MYTNTYFNYFGDISKMMDKVVKELDNELKKVPTETASYLFNTKDNTVYSTQIDFPGVKKENLSITITGSLLNLSGKKNDGSLKELALTLPKILDGNTMQAKLEDGVLTLTAKVKETSLTKKIEVK